jgi:hypothetical protein
VQQGKCSRMEVNWQSKIPKVQGMTMLTLKWRSQAQVVKPKITGTWIMSWELGLVI